MAKRSKKPPPRVYHDGLIPTNGDPSLQSYPEVVPDDHDTTKNEKSYPEVAPEQPQPAVVTPPTTGTTQVSVSGLSPLSAPPLVPPLPLPRRSGVHSLREAWSEVDEPEGSLPPEDRVPLWKRPIFWVIVIALAIIIALAGILGGVASGSIKTALDPGASQTTPPVTNPTCPGSNNLNYTSPQKTFRIQCDADYPNGDGTLGLQNTNTIDSLASCLDACAREAECVGAVFRPGTSAQCWLKQYLGVVKTGQEGAQSGVLWQ
ncbi:hypothetical protein C8A03DRAFT_44232 [Achaetomium macrosporum]|uniref:Apple domain-containing protein n=1 Tax=Achaetomium macrosporum TaxID=79813 RepID=A0AAN7H6X6_9PEZI|nr:hypothetical protein C8A03DRAFT_44232 [Achaetomium macrosporum]